MNQKSHPLLHPPLHSPIHPLEAPLYALTRAKKKKKKRLARAAATAAAIYSHHGDDQAASIQSVLADHQLFGAVRGEGGRLPAQVDAQSQAEEVPQLVPVPLPELPGGAHPTAPAQR